MKKISLIFSLLILPLVFFTACEDVSGVQSGDKVTRIELVDADGAELADIRVQLYAPSSSTDPEFNTYQVNLNVMPSSAANKDVTYESSSRQVFTVDENGLITTKGYGRAALIVRAKDGSRVVARYNVYIVKFITSFGFTNVTDGETMFTGDSLKIQHSVQPTDATITELTYSYRLPEAASGSAADVLTVDASGMLRIKGVGAVIISATTTDGSDLTEEYHVTIDEKIFLDSLYITDVAPSLKEFRNYDMKANVVAEPAEASYYGRYKFTSSQPAIATVDPTTGEVTALTTGTTIIKIESLDGSNLQVSVNLAVTSGVTEIVKTDWAAWAKSAYAGTSYVPANGINGNKSNFWHSSQNATNNTGDPTPPHWFIIDTKEWNTFNRWTIWRASGTASPDMKEATVYVCTETEDAISSQAEAIAMAGAPIWTRAGAIDFVTTSSGQSKTHSTFTPISTRYIKIVMNTTRVGATNDPVKMADFSIYKLDE